MKNNEWLVAQSFERVHEVISAINTLSIHAKLTIAGIDDSSREGEVRKARERVCVFLDRLQEVLQNAADHHDRRVLGTDPRLGQLAKRFLAVKNKWPCPTGLYSVPLPQVRALILSEAAEHQKTAINALHELRLLLEEHAHADIIGLLGNI